MGKKSRRENRARRHEPEFVARRDVATIRRNLDKLFGNCDRLLAMTVNKINGVGKRGTDGNLDLNDQDNQYATRTVRTLHNDLNEFRRQYFDITREYDNCTLEDRLQFDLTTIDELDKLSSGITDMVLTDFNVLTEYIEQDSTMTEIIGMIKEERIND